MSEPVVEPILREVVADEGYRKAVRSLQADGAAVLCGVACSARAMAIAQLYRDAADSILVVTPDQAAAEALLGDLEVLEGEGEVYFFPETEVIPYDKRSPHLGLLGERVPTLGALVRGQRAIYVTTARALVDPLVAPDEFRGFVTRLAVGDEIDRDELAEALQAVGFRAERLVEEIGTFATRGGLIDFYPFGRKHPVRVEFFGDEIESIRTFDPASQRTVDAIEFVEILPQREMRLDDATVDAARKRGELPFSEGASPWVDGVEAWLPRFFPRTAGLLDYFGGNVVVLDEPSQLEEAMTTQAERAKEAYEAVVAEGGSPPPPELIVRSRASVVEGLKERRTLRLALFPGDSVQEALSDGKPPSLPTHRMTVNSQETFRGNFAVLRDRFSGLLEEGNTLWLLCDNQGQMSRLEEMLEDLASRIHLAIAPLRNGFSLPSRKLVVLTDHELFARTARRYRAFRHGGGAPIHDYQTLKRGDYVVHVDHGIGRYDGIELVTAGTVHSECLKLRYRDNDTIFVPIDQINLVRKYVGGEGGEPPVVEKLGSTRWEKTKAKTKKAVEKMAGQLLEIHAARAAKKGHAFPTDGEWQREMEASFLYEETADQRTSTDAVKRDMMDEQPMDRLICGDVGYGKTEVAVRAAFKAATNGKQVVVLVPTTILAQQHYETFRERLRAYPVTVDVMSRFRGPQEQKKTVARVKSGEVDILIGTHRILSKDIELKDIGLVIIDEEQRFGVKHKERLKELRKTVDVLTLTATPIPRTLNMALVGLKDISVINTPPPNKLPIVTEVVESSDEVIRKAIRREVERGGQVFFVHNRVRSIEEVSAKLRALLPELRFDVAHGQMGEKELERVMQDFLERRSDVLVSTMIIESGLDLPNVNTILINRADTFGLAQLYQLRGRVGRSNHRAYAYLLIPAGAKLTDIARKRLRAIEEFSDLGAGFRLAMRDMEIRGAGNFLGPEQSGHMNAVGYDLYCQMLREEIAKMRGEEAPEERVPVNLDVPLDAYLPEEYIDDPDQRILFYKRLADLAERSALESLREELRDRYGRLPHAAGSLLSLKELRLLAEERGVEEIRIRGGEASIRFLVGREPAPEQMKEILRVVSVPLAFEADPREGLRVKVRADDQESCLEAIRGFLRVPGASDTLTVSSTP